jgi:hypothetical protein
MRQHVAIVAAVLLTVAAVGGVVAGAQSGAPATPDAARDSFDQTPGPRTITVEASGSAAASPNQVTVRLRIVETAADPGAARAELARNVSTLRSALDEVGVGDDEVATADYNLRYDRDPDLSADGPYRAEHAFTVRVSDMETAGRAIDAATGRAGARIDGVHFGVSADRRETLEQRALTDAMSSARAQARTLAAESNLSLAGVRSVETVSVDRGPGLRYERAMMTSDAAGAPATDIEGGPVSVGVRVVVTFDARAD